jgi:hypothetical protein
MRSIAGHALKHKDECDRWLKSQSNARNCYRIPTAQGWKRWRLGLAKATAQDVGLREVQSILPLAFDRSALDHTILRSIALAGTPNFSSSQFCPL